MQRDSELIGRLYYKEGHDLYYWRKGWFMLEGSALRFSSGEEEDEEEVLHLKRLQELSKAVAHFVFPRFLDSLPPWQQNINIRYLETG